MVSSLVWLTAGTLTLFWPNFLSAVIFFAAFTTVTFICGITNTTNTVNQKTWIEKFKSMQKKDKITLIISILFIPGIWYIFHLNISQIIHTETLFADFGVLIITLFMLTVIPFLLGIGVKKIAKLLK